MLKEIKDNMELLTEEKLEKMRLSLKGENLYWHNEKIRCVKTYKDFKLFVRKETANIYIGNYYVLDRKTNDIYYMVFHGINSVLYMVKDWIENEKVINMSDFNPLDGV